MIAMLDKKVRGVALITVMLIVALAAILATQMNSRLLLQMQRTTNIGLNQQAYWYAMGAEAFAKRVLLDVFKNEPDTTNLSQPWAQGETSFPVDNGTITGEIIDLQACLNLNALRAKAPSNKTNTGKQSNNNNKQFNNRSNNNQANSGTSSGKKTAPAKEALIELITSLDVEGVSQFEAEYMADALTDWLDENDAIASAGGAEDNDYAAKEFPYLPANNFLASVNELRVIEHFTVPVIQALREYVCVIPNSDLYQLNVNTISVEHALLLHAVLNIPLEDAEQVLSARNEKGFKSVEDFFKTPELAKIKISEDKKQQIVVDSEYFKLKASASFNESYFALNSILQIIDNQKIEVISRSIGK